MAACVTYGAASVTICVTADAASVTAFHMLSMKLREPNCVWLFSFMWAMMKSNAASWDFDNEGLGGGMTFLVWWN